MKKRHELTAFRSGVTVGTRWHGDSISKIAAFVKFSPQLLVKCFNTGLSAGKLVLSVRIVACQRLVNTQGRTESGKTSTRPQKRISASNYCR